MTAFTVDDIVYRRSEPGDVVRPMIQLLPVDVVPYCDVAWMCHSLPATEQELDVWVHSGRIPRHPRPR